MVVRVGVGVVLCLVGAVWLLQGLNVVKGSGMSGHGVWSVAGVVLVAIGIVLLRGGVGRRRR